MSERVDLGTGEWIERGNRGLRLRHEDGTYTWLGDDQELAALALHAQPFGFTWEDVDELSTHAAACRLDAKIHDAGPRGYGYNPGEAEAYRQHAATLDSIAARITALLPPRNTEG